MIRRTRVVCILLVHHVKYFELVCIMYTRAYIIYKYELVIYIWIRASNIPAVHLVCMLLLELGYDARSMHNTIQHTLVHNLMDTY